MEKKIFKFHHKKKKKSDDKPLKFQFFQTTPTERKFREFQSQWFIEWIEKEKTHEEIELFKKRVLELSLEITKTYESINKITKRIQESLERC